MNYPLFYPIHLFSDYEMTSQLRSFGSMSSGLSRSTNATQTYSNGHSISTQTLDSLGEPGFDDDDVELWWQLEANLLAVWLWSNAFFCRITYTCRPIYCPFYNELNISTSCKLLAPDIDVRWKVFSLKSTTLWSPPTLMWLITLMSFRGNSVENASIRGSNFSHGVNFDIFGDICSTLYVMM